MSRKPAVLVRTLAAAFAAVLLVVAAPPSALAERPNIWRVWVDDLGDRENLVEVPFLVIVSIAPMVAITPIWLAQLAYDAAKGDD